MISEQDKETLIAQAKTSERKRSHLLLHENHEALLHRLVIGMSKGTYVKPHNHLESGKEEVLFVLCGEVCVVCFDDQGKVTEKVFRKAGDLSAYCELTSNTWHTLYPVTDEVLLVEIKRGPFVATSKTEFAPWAPNEGDKESKAFLDWLELCQQGECYEPLED